MGGTTIDRQGGYFLCVLGHGSGSITARKNVLAAKTQTCTVCPWGTIVEFSVALSMRDIGF